MNGDNGWIKIHRDIWNNPWMYKPNVLTVWVYILCHVNYQPTDVIFEGKRVTLQPGQGLFKFTEVAETLGIPTSTLYRIVDLLKNENQIEKQKSPRNTVITVVNWVKYQVYEKQNEKQMRNKWETNEKQMGNLHINNKNLRNKELKNTTPAEEEQQSEYKVFTEKWNALPLHNIVSLKGKRLDMLRARVKEYGMDDVLKAIGIIQRSPFLLGQNNSRWQITIDWFLKPNNFPKVLEGNYLPKEDEPAQAENKFNKVLAQNKQPGEDILFMDIVRAYKEAKTKGETRTLQEYAEEYRQRKRGEMNGAGNTEGVV